MFNFKELFKFLNSDLITLRLFKPKFTFSRTRKINYICLLLISCIWLDVFVLESKHSYMYFILFLVCAALTIIGSLFRLNNLKEIKQPQGDFIGQISLDFEEIIVRTSVKEQIKIRDIKNIDINIRSIKGQYDGYSTSKFYYENGLSNGTENFIIMVLNNGIIKKYQFEYIPEISFLLNQKLIEHYYKIGIMDYLNCVDILGLDKREDWEKFKKLRT